MPDLEQAALDLEIGRFVRAVQGGVADHAGFEQLPLAEQRRVLEAVRRPWTRGGPELPARDLELAALGGLRLRIYRGVESGGPQPALIYLHGGGWTCFSLDTHDRLLREYAARAELTVIGVDYALSPEARYPVALGQVLDLIEWLAADGGSLRVDPARLLLGGDSAGANLALAAAMALRDRSRPGSVRALLLNYGVFDYHMSDEAIERFGNDGSMLSATEMRQYWHNYIRDPSDLDDPLVCPLRGDPAGLPPALFVVPELDVLAEQSERMADRMAAQDGTVEVRRYRGATHSFLEAVSISAVANRALDQTATWLRKVA